MPGRGILAPPRPSAKGGAVARGAESGYQGGVAPTWDERYGAAEYYYGTAPNVFLARTLALLPPGRGLFLGEGEGRNAVHAAAAGHEVVAVDASAVGREKALRLARDRGVSLQYILGDVMDAAWDDRPFDFAALVFLHLPPDLRGPLHRRVARALRPGGALILESFAKGQLGRTSGGPPRLELLHDLEDLRGDFAGWRWEIAEEREAVLDESAGHRGAAVVNRLFGFRD